MTRGKLVHDVLKRFIEGVDNGRLEPATADALRTSLLSLAEDALGNAEASGLTGAPLLWREDRAEIVDDLAAWLEQELADPGPHTGRALEVGFGFPVGDGEDRLARPEPFELAVGQRTLRLGGRIDRIDHGPGGFRVIDYKTGKGPGVKSVQLDAGKALQLPLYALVGAWLLGVEARLGEAAYHVVSRAGDFRRLAVTREELERRRTELDRVLERILEGIATGDFHQEPSTHCRWCDYDSLCDAGRRRIIDRKQNDERVVSLRALKEPT